MNSENQFIQSMIDLMKRFTPKQRVWSRWECISTSPLMFSGFGGEVRAGGQDGTPLTLTSTANHCEWKTGDKAAILLNPDGALVLDRIETEQDMI